MRNITVWICTTSFKNVYIYRSGELRKPLSGVNRTKDSTDKFYRGEAYKIYSKFLRGYQLYHENSMSRLNAIDSAIKYCSAYNGLADATEALRYQMITVSSQVVAKKGYTATKTFNSTMQKKDFKNARNQALFDYYGKIPIGSISKATDMNKLYFTLDMRPQQDDGVFPRQLGSYSYIAGQGYATVSTTTDNSKTVIDLYKENTYQIGKWCMGYPILINDNLTNSDDNDEYPGVDEVTDGGDDYCSLFGRGLTGDANFNNTAVRLATLIKNKKTMSELPSYTVNGESNANKICLPLKPSNAIIQFSGGNSTLEGITEADVRKFLIREGFPTIQAGSTVYDSSKITLAQLKNSALGLPQAIKTQVLDRKNSNGKWVHLSHLSSNVNNTIDAYMNIEVTKDGEDVTPSIIQANIGRLRDDDDGYYDPVEGFKYFELDYTAANGIKRKHRYYYPARFYKANYDDLPTVVKNRLTAAYGDSSMVGNTGYVYISGNNYTVKSSQATTSYVAIKKKKYMDMLKLYMRTLNFRYKLMFNYVMPETERIYGLLNLAPTGDMNPHTGYGACFPYTYIIPANVSTASPAYTTLKGALQRAYYKGNISTASNVSNATSVVGGNQPSGNYIMLSMYITTTETTLPATVTDSENGNSYVKNEYGFGTTVHELTHRNHKNDACYWSGWLEEGNSNIIWGGYPSRRKRNAYDPTCLLSFPFSRAYYNGALYKSGDPMMHMDLNTRKPLVNTKYTENFVLGSGKTTVAAKLSAIPVDTTMGDKYSAITTAAGNDTQKGFSAVVTLESALKGTCSVKAYSYTDVVTINTTLASSKSGDTITAKYPVMYSFAYPKYITKYECGQTFIRWILWSVLQGWDAAWARGNHKKFVYNNNSGGIINSSTGEIKVY